MGTAAASRPARAAIGPRLRLAGAALLCRADGSLEALAPRDAALLAWLALEGPTDRGRLAALLWPDSDAARARNALRQRLFQLRRLAGSALVLGSAVLSLAPGVTHDLEGADTLLGEGALPLSAEFGDWLTQQRMARRQRRLQVLGEQADAAERAADLAQALVHAGALLALDPLSEPAHRRLMRLHYLAGDRPAALIAFDRCEQALKHEVGVGPGPETLALLAVVERAQPLAGQRPGMPAALLRPPRLVGRQLLLQQGLAAWARGQALLVCGEPGLGTSRLLQELGAAQPGFVQVAAHPNDQHRPGAAMARLLRAVLDRLPGRGAALPARQRDVVALLQAARQQGLQSLLLDDLHLADLESLAQLVALLRQPAGAALLPCWGLGLSAGAAAGAAWPAQLLQEGLLHPLRLAPLELAQQHELLDSLDLGAVDAGRLTAPLHRLAGGHPKFMLELLRQAHESAAPDAEWALAAGDDLPLPAGALQQLQDRLQWLAAPARRLLQAAALAAEPVDAGLAAAVLDLPAAQRSEACAVLAEAGMLRDGAPAYELLAAAEAAGEVRRGRG
ncbi:MAG: BTAD domain-containing putative transcriptional regulator, partial [Roseateles sp.]